MGLFVYLTACTNVWERSQTQRNRTKFCVACEMAKTTLLTKCTAPPRGCYPARKVTRTRSVTTQLRHHPVPTSTPPPAAPTHECMARGARANSLNSLCPFQEARAPLGAARCLMAHGSHMVGHCPSAAPIPPRCCHDECLSDLSQIRCEKIGPRLVLDLEHADVSGLPLLVS